MPRARGRGARGGRGAGRARGRTATAPEVNETEEFLRQAIATSAKLGREGKIIKKRRVAGRLVTEPISEDVAESSAAESVNSEIQLDSSPASKKRVADSGADSSAEPAEPATLRQVVFASSEESDESDLDFEDVDLGTALVAEPGSVSHSTEPKELSIVLGGQEDTRAKHSGPFRKGVTAQERKLRLDIHKMHTMCLLFHVSIRNHWCNDPQIQAVLSGILSEKTVDYLTDDEAQSQYQRGRSFKEGMEQAVEEFHRSFRVSARGMSRSYWADSLDEIASLDIPDDIDLPIEKPDFRRCATKLSASRDVGAQLFCALLRGLGMDVRLVCSLQSLPVTSAAKGIAPAERKVVQTVPHQEMRAGLTSDGSPEGHGRIGTQAKQTQLSSPVTPARNATGTASGSVEMSSRTSTPAKRRGRESRFPIYWVEVFEPAYQRWTPVDPLVTGTIAKPAKLEPPANDHQNTMSYVIAFEEDGSARDVTRRYAKAYNAKTRKTRVEATKDGERWWKRVLRLYRRRYPEDRDQVEDAQLLQREAAEEMPRNIQDFKDHPYYALKRHLRKNEVIHPERQIGKVFTGRLADDNVQESEPVFRRRDVQSVKSADSWYRLGREIKQDEQPLKRAEAKKNKSTFGDDGDDERDSIEHVGAPLYAGYQTELYEPPHVVKGRVPKNRFGNLDIYTPSMIPAGGVHVMHAGASSAARLLGIYYADAVTGFEFRGRQGTAVLKGAVVAVQYLEAVVDVIHGLAYDKAADIAEQRQDVALRSWRRFLQALRIRERIQGYAIEGEQNESARYSGVEGEDDDDESYRSSEADHDDRDEDHRSNNPVIEDDAQDFLPDYATFLSTQPPVPIMWSTAKPPIQHVPDSSSSKVNPTPSVEVFRNARYVAQKEKQPGQPGGVIPEDGEHPSQGDDIKDSASDTGGGFLLDDDSEAANHIEGGGGFLPEDTDPAILGEGGGFVLDGEEGGGGFVVEDSLSAKSDYLSSPEPREPQPQRHPEPQRPTGLSSESVLLEHHASPDPPANASAVPDTLEQAQLQAALAASRRQSRDTISIEQTASISQQPITRIDGSSKSSPAESGIPMPSSSPHTTRVQTEAVQIPAATVPDTDAVSAAQEGDHVNVDIDVDADMGVGVTASAHAKRNPTIEGGRDASSSSSADSLLSHDPEDEDADPEWLV